MIFNSKDFANSVSGVLGDLFDENITIKNISSDSRKIEGGGNLFVALRGDRFDGHNFVSEITKDGKNFALIEDSAFSGKNTILVPDVRKALFSLAVKYRNEVLGDKKCVAITGSVGKTSTKEYTNAVISSKYKVYKSPGNQNSYTGLPMVMLNCDGDFEYLVLELGMNTAGEISKLSTLVKPDIGIITNIGWSHSEYLGGRDKIFEEKLDITVGMNDGILVVNDDDDMLCQNLQRGCKVVRCSVENKNADFYCSNIESENGVFKFKINGKDLMIHQVGVHNVKNAMLAYAAGILSGVSHDEASFALSSIPAFESRIKVRESKCGCTVIEDCYNAAPESMKAALDYLKTQSKKRIAVLGDMLELGEASEMLHLFVGNHAAECCDEILCFGELGKYIAEGAIERGMKNVSFFPFEEREEFISAIREKAVDCSILFKASNRMRFPEVIKTLEL